MGLFKNILQHGAPALTRIPRVHEKWSTLPHFSHRLEVWCSVLVCNRLPNHRGVKGNAKHSERSGVARLQRDTFHFAGPQCDVGICVGSGNCQVCAVKRCRCVRAQKQTHRQMQNPKNVTLNNKRGPKAVNAGVWAPSVNCHCNIQSLPFEHSVTPRVVQLGSGRICLRRLFFHSFSP